MGKVKIDKIDITGLLGRKITVCILQLKSPFDEECRSQLVRGFTTLTWNRNELQKRKKRILSLLSEVKDYYRTDVDIVLLPEYSIHYEMMKDLQDFANSRNVILVGTYYDDRCTIENKENKNFRKNICSVNLPNGTQEEFVKLDKTRFEADFIEDTEDNKKRILQFYWRVNEHKLCLQIFICGDFLDLYRIDRKHGGIVIVPACSPKIDEFKLYSNECIKPHPESKVVRCVFVCNAVSLPEQQTKLRIIGNSQIFGPYEGKLPVLGTDVEGGIIASVNCLNILTKPSIIPSKHNIVIEGPISFSFLEKNGNLEIVETKALESVEARIETVAVAIVQKGSSVLLVRRKRPGRWLFPTGIIRLEEKPEERAEEEVFNETNVSCRVFKKIGERLHPDYKNKSIYYHCLYLHGEAENRDKSENAEVKWIKARYVEKYLTSDLYSGIESLLTSISREEKNHE